MALVKPNTLFEKIFRPEVDGRIALLYEGHEFTYEQTRAMTTRAAEILKGLDVSAGDRVAILLHDSPEFIASFIAIISLGAIAVPINMALRRQEQHFILNDCGARLAIVENEAAGNLFAELPDGSALPFAALSDLLIVDRGNPSQAIGMENLAVHNFENFEGQRLTESFLASQQTDVPAFILYTSGSTGEPKGAVHRQTDIFCTNETYCREVLQLRESDRLFSSSRLPFAYGLGNALTFPLLNGVTTILCREKPTPGVVAAIFRDYKPTIFFGVPVVYRMLLEYQRTSAAGQTGVPALDTHSLRLCISAGEALPRSLGEEWERTFKVEALDGIGSTEMLHMFMSNHARDLRYGSSGKLLQGYDARLIDYEGEPTPAGEVGNLWIRGNSAAIGYWQRPGITAETFVNGWVRTGDLYRCDEDGFWWHMGRSDDCFKPTGQWVSPIEVEGVLLKNPEVRMAAVVEGFDENGLSCVCAFVVPANEPAFASLEQELRAHCTSELPRFKQPRRYIFVSDLPYTATGKVQRFKLRNQLRAERAAS